MDLDLAADRLPDDTARSPRARPSRSAVAAAILLHAAVLIWFLGDWRSRPAPEPPSIPISLVFVPPPEPAPPPPPEKPQPPAFRESGPDEHTTAPPAAEAPAPEPEAPAPPPGPPVPVEHADKAAPPAGAPEAAPRPPAPRAEPRKEAALPRAPKPQRRVIDRAPGEKIETGDPYLNLVWGRIEQNRAPTTPIGPSGLHLAGISTYAIVIDRTGQMKRLELANSSGSPLLDDEARRMIVGATPFPPLPAQYPAPATFTVTIQLYPQ